MNLKILGLVSLLAVSFVAAVIWKMDRFIISDRSSWAEAQLRTQVSSLQLYVENNIKAIHRLGSIVQQNKKDKSFWAAMEPFKAVAWIRSFKNPTFENINIKEGIGLDDTTLAASSKVLQGL